MIDAIQPLVTIPSKLRTAAFQKELVPFIGAGVSQLSGCPGWGAFANAALMFFVEHGHLSHAEFDQVSTLSARVKLSIALDLKRRHQLAIDFEKLLEPDPKKRSIGEKIYNSLSQISSIFVTTNYDNLLDARGTRISKKSDISVANLDLESAVIHIHGSVYDPNDMVLTTVDYLERYASHKINGAAQENSFLTFLEQLFKQRSILFVGYGLEELEILEYIFQKGIVSPNENEEPRHFVLQGFFSHQLELVRNLEAYYRKFGIKLLAFSRDMLDWYQLVDVLDDLAKNLPPGSNLMSPKLAQMEVLLT